MASISNAKLTISHDHTKRTARPIVKAQIVFTQFEMSQMSQGLKFKLKCQLWARDTDPFDTTDDLLFTYSTVKYYPDATPAVTEDASFDVTLAEGVLDEDFGLAPFDIDEVYARLILINQYTGIQVKKNTNTVQHRF
jgi:hypothetical protein